MSLGGLAEVIILGLIVNVILDRFEIAFKKKR